MPRPHLRHAGRPGTTRLSIGPNGPVPGRPFGLEMATGVKTRWVLLAQTHTREEKIRPLKNSYP
jgi:hypothetical protein